MTAKTADSAPKAWDDPWWNPPGPGRRLSRLFLVVLALAGIGLGVYLLDHIGHRKDVHPGGTPSVVSRRTKLPSCGHYRAWWGMAQAPPGYKPSAAVLTADRCLRSAFEQGRPAELIVTGQPDDIGHTSQSFYRVVGKSTLEVIWEDVPPWGRIQAGKFSDCTTLTEVNGQIRFDDCHPSRPTYD